MDKLFEDSELIVHRFACDCLFQGHIVDITLELADEGTRVVNCGLELYMLGKAPLKYRLEQIWRLLRGRDGMQDDFIIREEDIPHLISILKRALKEANDD